MKVTFLDNDLEELYKFGINGKYKKYSKDKRFMENLVDSINILFAVSSTSELSKFSYLHYEKLKRIKKSSIRVMNGRVERIIFTEKENGIEVEILELDQNHYGRKK